MVEENDMTMRKPFDFRVAEQLARASAVVYHFDDHGNFNFAHQPELKRDLIDSKPVSVDTSHAGVLSYLDKTIVVFRGTDPNVEDWIQNFRADLVAFNLGNQTLAGEVHRGFLDELERIYDQIAGHIRQMHADSRQLLVTGHSQGGAVAALAVAALTANGHTVDAAYTFAAPRCGNLLFARSLTRMTIHRVELGNDIVPHVPPVIPPRLRAIATNKSLLKFAPKGLRRLFLHADNRSAYVTVGRLAYAEFGRFVLPNLTPSQESELFDDRLVQLLQAGDELYEHHDIDNYVASVDKL